MSFQGINHLALVTNDMRKTVKFYRDFLGMPLVGTLGGEIGGKSMRHYFFGIGPGSSIAFFEWPDATLPISKDAGVPASGRHFDHVSINVDSEETLLAIQKRAEDYGLNPSSVVHHAMVDSIYFEDPNGISLEFSVAKCDLEQEPFFHDPTPVSC